MPSETFSPSQKVAVALMERNIRTQGLKPSEILSKQPVEWGIASGLILPRMIGQDIPGVSPDAADADLFGSDVPGKREYIAIALTRESIPPQDAERRIAFSVLERFYRDRVIGRMCAKDRSLQVGVADVAISADKTATRAVWYLREMLMAHNLAAMTSTKHWQQSVRSLGSQIHRHFLTGYDDMVRGVGEHLSTGDQVVGVFSDASLGLNQEESAYIQALDAVQSPELEQQGGSVMSHEARLNQTRVRLFGMFRDQGLSPLDADVRITALAIIYSEIRELSVVGGRYDSIGRMHNALRSHVARMRKEIERQVAQAAHILK